MVDENSISIFTDGGSRGNPGPSAVGVYAIDSSGNILFQLGKRLGRATNNIAEYTAVLEALTWLSSYGSSQKISVNFYLDSQLVVSQINGLWKVKNPELLALLYKIREKEAGIKAEIRYNHVPREQNKQADKLVNMALDNKI